MGIKSYGYLRVSSVGQLLGYGIDRQRETIEKFAKKADIELVGWFQDEYTGTESNRPQFMAMLAVMMGNGVKTVVCECLDRLARDLIIQTVLLAKLELEHIALYSALTGDNITECMQEDPMRRAMVQIQGVFAELDKNLTVRKLRKGREACKKEKGRCEGRKPFGFYPGEEKVLTSILDMSKLECSDQDIADALNSIGSTRRKGKEWTRHGVRKILMARAKHEKSGLQSDLTTESVTV